MHKKKKKRSGQKTRYKLCWKIARAQQNYLPEKKNIKKLEKLVANLGQKEMANAIAILW